MENKNGQGIFYGVIGVATLVVAIIGATFAYFSASVTGTGNNIEGTTANVAGSLSLEVTKVTLADPAPAYTDLVPADVTESESGWTSMLTADCVSGDYTGCHLYEVVADTDTDITASIKINVDTTANPKTNWKYVVYEGSDSAITTGSAHLYTMGSGDQTIFSNTLTTSGKTYYVLVYLLNTDSSQNDGETQGTTDETGTYNGTVTLSAASGAGVKATFS